MDFNLVQSLMIPEGEVFSISAGGQTLWTKPGVPAADYIFVDTATDTYILDYQITTGTECGVADLEYTFSWEEISLKSGWSRMIGFYTSDTLKWHLGCYKGGSLNPGTQFGSNGDRTLTIYQSTYSRVARRDLWYFGLGYLTVYSTPGNWVNDELYGNRTGGNSYTWTEAAGTNIQIGGMGGGWYNQFNLYGLRIYNQGSTAAPPTLGTLLAEYIPQQQNGVWGLYNTISGNFITKQ